MANTPSEDMPSASQWPHAAIVAVIGVVAVAVVAAIAIYHYTKASDAVTALGPVIGGISSLVAAYFGIRAGTVSQQKQNENLALLNSRPLPDPCPDEGGGGGAVPAQSPSPSPSPTRRPQTA